MAVFQISTEIWKPIPAWEGLYEASNYGRIRGLRRNPLQVLKTKLNRQGYPTIGLKRSSSTRQQHHFVHRLIAATFVGPLPEGHQVDHLDGCKTNNWANNLEYVLPGENIRRAIRMGLRTVKVGSQLKQAKLTNEMVRLVRSSTEPCIVISRKIGINLWTVHDARSGRTWKHVE